ncbi:MULTISPECIES: hypothetical protein [unclassified Streptomyces]|uniref:hypothetical protein n=1 Tax=unclassified Streptomyces TaxID=2593676 RepID=UPI00278C6E85|nr:MULTISPECIES: hypothetical protein [unclassified Streptomyces]
MDSAGRYRLTLTVDGATVATGWWEKPATADKKFRDWIGDHGHGTARIFLVDTETGETLKAWP